MSWTNVLNQNMQERYKNIKEKDQNDEDRRESESQTDTFLNKSLSVSLDTFDNFYCRRCMVNTRKKYQYFAFFFTTILLSIIR